MKARSFGIGLIFIRIFGLGLSCSKEDLSIIPNALTKCPTNDSCIAECYRGYIFPSGNTKTEYSCQNGDWTPLTSACKRVPIIHIQYAAIWKFSILPSHCDNISIWLNASKKMLEEEFLESCGNLPIDLTAHFSFETLAVQVTTVFSAEYTNYTKKENEELCSRIILIRFELKNFPLLNRLFHNITCENQVVNYTVFKNLFIGDRYEQCPAGLDVRNVTVTESEEQYCDFAVTDSSSTSVTDVREQTTAPLTNIQDATTLSKEQTDLKDGATGVTTFSMDDETTDVFPVVNSSTELANDRLTINVIYIGASAGGATVLIVLVIVVVVCWKKRSEIREGHLKTLEMKEYASDDSFKGELTENVFYQSADDFVNDSKNVHPRTSTEGNLDMYSTAKSTNKTETGLNSGVEILNQASSLKPVDKKSINGGREAEIVDNLKCDAPIVKDYKDSSHILFNAEEYAMINKSDKPL